MNAEAGGTRFERQCRHDGQQIWNLKPVSIFYLHSINLLARMPQRSRFEPSTIKNKIKREDIANKNKKAKNQQKLQKRLAQAKLEANDPAAKKVGHLATLVRFELI